jgi:DNA invertase Pin-like site-specific DNA recombinase
VVRKLDRLSRSLRDVLTIMEQLGEAATGFRSLTEAIDTTTPAGRMTMQMVGVFAEFEKSMLKERTKAIKRPPMPQGFARSIRQPSPGCWRERHAPGRRMPK